MNPAARRLNDNDIEEEAESGPSSMSEEALVEVPEVVRQKRRFFAATTGTVVAMLCCFTPMLVFTLAAVGVTAFTPYLDFVLLPAMAIFGTIAVLSWRRWRSAACE